MQMNNKWIAEDNNNWKYNTKKEWEKGSNQGFPYGAFPAVTISLVAVSSTASPRLIQELLAVDLWQNRALYG